MIKEKFFRYIFFLVFSIYLLFNINFLIKDNYFFIALPFLIILTFISIIRLDLLILIISFFTPLSVSLKEIGFFTSLGIDMAIPTEPILFILLFIIFLKMIDNYLEFQILFSHNITKLIVVYLIWIFITSIKSSIPLISFKVLITRLWYILTFYVLASQIFKKQFYRLLFIKSYIIGLLIVCLFTLYNHYHYNFSQESAHWVMSPFFKDHTSYGMSLALFLPLTFYIFYYEKKLINRVFYGIILFIFIISFILSYTRAAWISIFMSLIFYSVVKLKIKFKYISVFTLVIFLFGYVFSENILKFLENNTQDSSDSFLMHIKSISNITSDASNLERINRWKSAIKLFLERPHFGWGIGTYQFNYSSYQNFYDKTIISTNFGDKGNAHSEYLSILSETGWFGLFSFLILLIHIFYSSINLISGLNLKKEKDFILSIFLSLITFFIHSFLNNFLDMDKASVPIWALISMVVMIDKKKIKI